MFLAEASGGNFSSLYKRAKSSRTLSVPLQIFEDHCKKLFMHLEAPALPFLPLNYDSTHPIMLEIQELETLQAINKQRSKACSYNGISPLHIKELKDELSAILTQTFNGCLKSCTFPLCWLELVMFFLHKKGPRDDANNYRSIAVENPIYKVFSTIMNDRLVEYAETQKLMPDFQFGFVRNRNTLGAIALLREIVARRLDNKKRTYVAFIDFKKAFDSIDRSKLLCKLQQFGIPIDFCNLLHFVLKNMKVYLKTEDVFSEPIETTTGVLQGDVLSPTLFNLFTSDLPDQLKHEGVHLDAVGVKYIMYADDLCLIAPNGKDLQVALDCLEKYCDKNNLTVNTKKSKLVIFHKGRLPYKQSVLERVNEFSYLGISLTSQMSFSSHIQSIVMRANSRIGLLYSKLDLQNMPIDVVKRVFSCYILPIFQYALVIWISGKFSSSSEQLVNGLFTKFWKRYLNIPLSTSNALTYYLAETMPLIAILRKLIKQATGSIYLPCCLSGVQLSFFNDLNTGEEANDFDWSSIPSFFWRSRTIWKLPAKQKYRKNCVVKSVIQIIMKSVRQPHSMLNLTLIVFVNAVNATYMLIMSLTTSAMP